MTPDPGALDAMTASVPSGELAAFGLAMDGAQKALVALAGENERLRSEKAALENRIGVVIAHAVTDERARAERAEAALSDALLRLAHGDAELHARLLADAGYDGLPDCGGRETEGKPS